MSWRTHRIVVAAMCLTCAGAGAFAQSDSCSKATLISLNQSVSGTTVGSTNDGVGSCGQSGVSPDVWFAFTAPHAGSVQVNTCGSAYDTVLSVHTACPGSAQNEIACNDDSCVLSSRVAFVASAGSVYYLRVAGFANATGAFTISVVDQQSDACAGAAQIFDGTPLQGSTIGSSNDGAAACGESATSADVWYRYTTTSACALTVSLCTAASYDSVISIHSACPGTAANQLACNDDFCGLASRVDISAAASTSYYIRVAGFRGATGTFTIEARCVVPGPVPNDNCVQAIAAGLGTTPGTTTGATNDGSAGCGQSSTSPDVWYSYTATEECILRASICPPTYDTVLSIHNGCPGTPNNQITCNDDSCALGSRVNARLHAGQTVLIRVSGFNGAAGDFGLTLACDDPPPPGQGADVYLGELSSFVQFGREGDTVGCAIDSPLCNAGSDELDWYANPDPRHPFMVFNMYRLDPVGGDATRLVQIGQSWAKHGYGAAQADACGLGCIPHPNSTRLGIGCSDTYSSANNAQQSIMGPRSEINPWTGAFTYAGSHFDTPQPPHTQISHRLQLRDADLNPALHADAQYFGEVYILAHDDSNHMNSAAYERVGVSGAPGGTWTFDMSGAGTVVAPAINAWPGATFSIIPGTPVADGRCILGARATPVPGAPGRWRYEYALYNHDMQRAVRAFSLPLGRASVSNIGFHAVASHDEPNVDNDPWTASVVGGRITWSTDAPGQGTANPLRWGTLYNFWFEADRAPVASLGTITAWLDGATLEGNTLAPAGVCPADFNRDGLVSSQDFFDFLGAFFANNADFNADGVTNSQDFFDFLNAFFSGC